MVIKGSLSDVLIRTVEPGDAKAIAAIYNYYIKETKITFEEVEVTDEEMLARISNVDFYLCWLVYVIDNVVIGYAYATKWRVRSAYRFSAELSVYVGINQHHRGVGSQLYSVLIAKLHALGLHSIIGGIALPNPVSIKLHEKFGFKKVAHFNEVGYKHGEWIDVGYWQLLFNDNI
jgi:L-amino acid N-acyltransferase YncA